MAQKSDPSTATLWARFRFSVVGSLLSAPPGRGELKAAICLLAAKTRRNRSRATGGMRVSKIIAGDLAIPERLW